MGELYLNNTVIFKKVYVTKNDYQPGRALGDKGMGLLSSFQYY